MVVGGSLWGKECDGVECSKWLGYEWYMNDLCELINIWNFGIIMPTTTSGKEETIMVLELVWRSCTFWRSIHIHINHSKLLII